MDFSKNPSDLGNAQRMVRDHGNNIRYCGVPLKKWFIWDGKRWRVDTTGEIYRIAKKVVRNIYREARQQDDDEERRKTAKHALRSEDTYRINMMIVSVQSEPGIPVTLEDFDKDRCLFNVLNGTIDLKTGRIRAHRKKDLITKIAPVVFDENADCPKWKKFLNTIFEGKTDLINYFQKIIGMSLTGDITEKVFFIFFGPTSTGKSTSINVIGSTMGDYWVNVQPEAFLRYHNGNSSTSYLARLKGARFITTSEPEKGKILKESLIKQLTGDDKVTARFLYREFFDFYAEGKVFFVTNHKPVIQGTDDAIWERVRLIPFFVSIPEADRIKGYAKELQTELPGILNWAIEGCLAWQKEGLGLPEEVKAVTGDYRNEMDFVRGFLDDVCIIDPDADIPVGRLYTAYESWRILTHEKVLSKKAFGKIMEEKGFQQKRDQNCRYWIGVRLNDFYTGFDDGDIDDPSLPFYAISSKSGNV